MKQAEVGEELNDPVSVNFSFFEFMLHKLNNNKIIKGSTNETQHFYHFLSRRTN